MTAPPTGPEVVSEAALLVAGGAITTTVLKFDDGAVRVRLGFGTDLAGHVLECGQIAALRTMLADALGAAYLAERSRAA